MVQTIITVIVFFVILISATWLWNFYNSSLEENNMSNRSTQGVTLINIFERDRIFFQEWFLGDTLQLVGTEVDRNSDVKVELAIEAIEVPDNLRIII